MKIVNSIYWLALVIWISMIVAAGVAAMGVFRVLPGLDLRVPAYSEYLGEDGAAHGRFAGGKVMEPIFAASDLTQAAAAMVLVVCLVIQWRMSAGRSGWGERVRMVAIAAAVAILGMHAIWLAPKMNVALREYWRAASENRVDDARARQAEFDRLHPVADRLFGVRLMLLLVAVPASAVALGRGEERRLHGAA